MPATPTTIDWTTSSGISMTEPRTEPDPSADARDETVALALRWGIPAITLLGFAAVLGLTSLGPALLVLASGVLIGAIALLWTSLRSLFGDMPIDDALDEAAAVARTHRSSRALERKGQALRALKDLELERAVGKIDDEDYAALVGRYRGEAKAAIRELDDQTSAFRARAEQLANDHIASLAVVKAKAKAKAARIPCPKCAVKNDPDAAFCKKCGAPMREPVAEETDDDDQDDQDDDEDDDDVSSSDEEAAKADEAKPTEATSEEDEEEEP